MRAVAAAVLGLGMVAACQMPAPSTGGGLPTGARTLSDLEYARPEGTPLHLDLYLPPGGPPAPLILWIHGGGWMEGDKEEDVDLVLPLVLRYGYAVAAVQYRLTDEAIFPAQIHDVKAAVRYLRANAGRYRLDPNRFGAWGESAGGHLVALLGATSVAGELEGEEGVTGVSSRVQAVFDWYGPTDLLQRQAQSPAGAANADAPDSPVSRLLGGPAPLNREKARQANPITYVKRGAPPFFIVHGDADDVVALGQSRLLAAALERVGSPVEFKILRGGEHGGAEYFNDAMLTEVHRFFERHVKRSGGS